MVALPMTLSVFEGHCRHSKRFQSQYLEKYWTTVGKSTTVAGRHTWASISTVVLERKDCSRSLLVT